MKEEIIVKRFEFRLARVLRLKKQKEWLAQLRLRQARAELDAVEAEIALLLDQLARAAADLEAQVGQALDALAWITRTMRAAEIGRALDALEVKKTQAARKLEEAQKLRTQLSQEVEALLFLQNRKLQDYRQDVAREQQEQLDELGMNRWNKRRSERSGA